MFVLEKKSLILYFIAFLILQSTFLYVMTTTVEIPFDSKKYILILVFALVAFIWFSYGLLRDTTELFLDKMQSRELQFLMQIISILVWFMVTVMIYMDFHQTSFYKEHPFILTAIVLPYVFSFDIWFKVAYTRIFMLWAKLRGYID